MAQRRSQRSPELVARRNARQLKAAHARLSTQPCILCQAPPTFVGFWSPGPAAQRQLLAAPGKAKVIGYSLCRRCMTSVTMKRRVEAEILARLAEVREHADVN